MAGVFGLEHGTHYSFRLSLGDRTNKEKYFDNDEAWEKGEALLREMLLLRGKSFVEAPDEAAFYGPKIDVQMRNVNGKEDTAFTVQYDFCMPERFDLSYTAKDGSKRRAFVVHRSSIGAIERVMAFLVEHFSGNFPLWLSPVQVGIVPIAEAHQDYAEKVRVKLAEAGIRVEVHTENVPLGKRLHTLKAERVPYILVVGDKEKESGTVSVEHRDLGKQDALDMDTFVAKVIYERDSRLLTPEM